MKLCPGEAAGSGCTDGSSVLWSSPCTLWWPESSQELRDHPAPLAGVAPPPRLLSLLCFREEPLGGGCILLILAALSSLLSWGCLSVPPRGLSVGWDRGSGLPRSWQAAEKLLLSCPRAAAGLGTRALAAGGREPASRAQSQRAASC